MAGGSSDSSSHTGRRPISATGCSSTIQRLAFSFHDRVATGELMARASTDLSQVRLVFAMLPITVANIGLVAITVVVLILIDPLLGVVASLAIPVLFLLAARYARRVTRLSFDVQQRLADLASVVEEGDQRDPGGQGLRGEAETVRRVDGAADGIFRRTMEMLMIRAANVPIFELVPAAGTLAVLWLGGYMVIEGRITLGDFVAFTQYLVLLVFPLRMTAWFFAELPRASASASRILQLLGTAPDITDPEKPRPLPEGNGDIRFAGVTFSYPGGSTGSHRARPPHPCRHVAGSGRRRRLGEDFARLPNPEVLRRHLGGDADRWRGRPPSASRRAAPRGRHRLRRPLPLLVVDPREHRLRCTGRHRRAGEAGRSACPAPTTSSWRCPMATTRWSGSAGTRSPEARDSGWRWRERCCATRGC